VLSSCVRKVEKMAIPVPLILAAALIGVVGVALAFGCGARTSPVLASQTNESSVHGTPTKGAMVTLDAFEFKEKKKQLLLERAQKRYLSIHPNFSPPSKVKVQ